MAKKIHLLDKKTAIYHRLDNKSFYNVISETDNFYYISNPLKLENSLHAALVAIPKNEANVG